MFLKNKQWKNFEFLTKTFGKIQFFFNLFKKGFYSLQSLTFHLEYQLKYICGLFFLEKQTMEKFRIFEQNSGLTPWEKFKFFHFFKEAFL